jgi:hypothetical protein
MRGNCRAVLSCSYIDCIVDKFSEQVTLSFDMLVGKILSLAVNLAALPHN